MAAARTGTGVALAWSDAALTLSVEVDGDGHVRLARLAPAPSAEVAGDGSATFGAVAHLPLVDVVTAGAGRAKSSRRYAESVTGRRLRYVGHEERDEPAWREICVQLEDPSSRLQASVTYRVLKEGGVLQAATRLCNLGGAPVTVESVTSFLAPGLAGPGGCLDDVDIWWADNEWLGEDRWHSRAFRDALADLGLEAHGAADPRGMFGLTSVGSWPSGSYLPMGAAVNRRTGHAWLWQVEHNGAWHWQVGEKPVRADGAGGGGAGDGAVVRDAYLALLGPTYAEHHWRAVLEPGESFETVPAALAVSADGLEAAAVALTTYRRAVRRPHEDHRRLPVIFNDYMNTLMGDPTTGRLLPLVDAAAKAGAEYFVIDAGWYAGLGEAWWDTVGAWAPSASRFPGGIEEVLGRIRERGMVPGLWLEPEVVGVNSPVARELPDDAFFSRGGQRVVENGRYQLDFSHPAARGHLERVVDSLVGELGVGYLKMDYNINIGPGTETGGASAGAGLLAHNRAFLAWVDGLLDRHRALTIESCASGAMRKDYATLSRFQLQSTSDQQDFLLYPAISAGAPMSVAPEQGAVWAYPQPGWSDDAVSFAMCNALLGRVHLSGHLDQMSGGELQLVADAISVYKEIRGDLARAVPFWPLGLPRWDDHWFALGMRAPEVTFVVAWHRGPIRRSAGAPAAEGPRADEAPAAVLPVSHLKGEQLSAKVLYPPAGRAATAAEWQPDAGELVVRLPRVPSACLVALGQDPGSVPVERLDATGAPLTDKQRARTDRKAGWQ
jgi:alpha-galactosidase